MQGIAYGHTFNISYFCCRKAPLYSLINGHHITVCLGGGIVAQLVIAVMRVRTYYRNTFQMGGKRQNMVFIFE
ncbi:hypothetical protein FQZ97_864730 [compost metagenome]